MSLLAQDDRLTRRVGAITLALVALAILFFVFVAGRIDLGATTRIRVYFRHSANLREHAPLVVGGKAIGRIDAIETVAHGGENPLHGEVGVVAIVAIDGDEAWKVPANAEIFLSSRGPLSEKYLEVAPPAGPPGPPGPSVREGDELRAIDPPSLDNVLQRAWTNMTTFRAFTAEVSPELTALRGELAKLDANLAAIDGLVPLALDARDLAARARQTYAGPLGGDAGLARAGAMLGHARGALAQTRSTIGTLSPEVDALAANLARVRGHLAATDPLVRLAATIVRVREVLAKVDPLLAEVDALRARVAAGEGSIGRLMNDPEFPEDAKELGKIMKRQPWKLIARPKD